MMIGIRLHAILMATKSFDGIGIILVKYKYQFHFWCVMQYKTNFCAPVATSICNFKNHLIKNEK